MRKIVEVVIPVYKPFLSADEMISLKRSLKVFSGNSFKIIIPAGLDLNYYKDLIEGSHVEYLVIEKRWFSSISEYNKLLLSKSFYENFSHAKYILICQLDAYVFSDSLTKWCEKDYDYIGAPWIDWEWSSFYAKNLTRLRRVASHFGYKNFNLVGNGGFSLRKVQSCINNLQRFKKVAANFKLNEDYFFSFYITSYNFFFKIPTVKEALNFSFDENPEKSFLLNGNKLPMACHGWPKYKQFWKNYIPEISNR